MHRLSPIILSYAHRLRISVGLPMHRLSPTILSYAHRLRVSVGLPMYLLSLVIHAQTNTNTPRCLLRSVVNDNTAAHLRHRGAIKIQAYYLVCP